MLRAYRGLGQRSAASLISLTGEFDSRIRHHTSRVFQRASTFAKASVDKSYGEPLSSPRENDAHETGNHSYPAAPNIGAW